ncbi:unnamed protein product [Thelazia callipaeda]|uniref:DDE_Tnp_1_7 domain-containing protein n=1 Tax=Thelazia callipaeda TaxID=103827 RepID=A0A0N5CSI4_THECL|nr:unnamed protein product [Thelazia callipaeda]
MTFQQFVASVDCFPPLNLTINETDVILFGNQTRWTSCGNYLNLIFGITEHGFSMRYKDKVNSTVRFCQLMKIETKKHSMIWTVQCTDDRADDSADDRDVDRAVDHTDDRAAKSRIEFD